MRGTDRAIATGKLASLHNRVGRCVTIGPVAVSAYRRPCLFCGGGDVVRLRDGDIARVVSQGVGIEIVVDKMPVTMEAIHCRDCLVDMYQPIGGCE